MTLRAFPSIALTCATLLSLAACGGDAGDAAADTDPAVDTAAAEPAAAAETEPLIDPNTASEEELRGAGLDSATVALIMAERPFEDMVGLNEQLSAQMDSVALDSLYTRMFIPLDLNTATEEAILLIPGVGSRMAHEFEEYRPYRAIEQFRREIGKYVDDVEVARLERYVVIR